MFSLTEISRSTQRFVCMALSAVIVTFALTAGAAGIQSAANAAEYSVTVTQLS